MSRLDNHIGSRIGAMRLDQLTHRDVREMHARATVKTPYEANRALELLRASINWAMAELGWRASDLAEGENPATRIKRNHEKNRREWVRLEELPAVMEAIDEEQNPWIRAFFRMLLYTGARKGELLTLQRADVDLKSQVIRFRDTKNRQDHEIPIGPDALKLLKSVPHALGNPYVFCGQVTGKPINNPYKPWARILKRSEISRHIIIHDLRRTVGSLLASSGYSTQQIGKLLNHKSTITAKVYAEIAERMSIVLSVVVHNGGNLYLKENRGPKPDENERLFRALYVVRKSHDLGSVKDAKQYVAEKTCKSLETINDDYKEFGKIARDL